MANVYNKGKFELSEGGAVDWNVDTVKMALVTSAYTYSADHNFADEITNELSGGNYSRVTMTNTGPTEDDTNDQVNFTGQNEVFSALELAAGQPYAAIILKDTGTPATSPLLAYVVLTTPPAPNGGDYQINMPTNGWIQCTDS